MKAVMLSLVVVVLGLHGIAAAQLPAKALWESGKYGEAIEQVSAMESPSENDMLLAALSAQKAGDAGQAEEWFGRLAGGENETWAAMGNAGRLIVQGNLDEALDAANRAVELEGDNPWAQYMLGQVLSRRGDFGGSASAFERATQSDPGNAYAQYYAGSAFYKAKRIDKMAVHFERFLKLAPNAPERGEVESIMRTVRGR
jgi:tetratricopeptide (TPR) repeat protein